MAKADSSYRIVDEPTPSALERVSVNPVWPFFATMFAGAWLAWPWFVINSFALGSSRRFGDLALVLAGFALTAVSVVVFGALLAGQVLDQKSLAYALLVPQALRVTLAYVLYLRQTSTFELFQYFGGVAKNGMLIVFAGALLRGKLMSQMPGLWALLVA